ncbi:fimbrial protein [unidentified bacterial endosymbiont]|uniref:fimbrial protein n=1 Tax=unidentified bacterial endosymbiont TaxID=2355 RepID=UPI0020A0626D|nr:fimbrial protein [unidentified bacterial endosymbiont]
MKKTFLITAFAPFIFTTSAWASDYSSGVVNFMGTINSNACVVDNSSAAQTIPLGDIPVALFSNQGTVTSEVNFDIQLLNCSTETFNNATVTFTGETVSGNASVLALLEDGETPASGVGVQILQNGTKLNFDGSNATPAFTIVEGTNVMSFSAQYISVAENVTPGSANATAKFVVNYN